MGSTPSPTIFVFLCQIFFLNYNVHEQGQPRADDVDEEQRDDPPDWEKMKIGLYF